MIFKKVIRYSHGKPSMWIIYHYKLKPISDGRCMISAWEWAVTSVPAPDKYAVDANGTQKLRRRGVAARAAKLAWERAGGQSDLIVVRTANQQPGIKVTDSR